MTILYYEHDKRSNYNSSQISYIKCLETLRCMFMTDAVHLVFVPQVALAGDNSEFCVLPVDQVHAEVVVDIGRSGGEDNRRYYRQGPLSVEEQANKPWSPLLKFSEAAKPACDLAVGVATQVQQSTVCAAINDNVAATKSGDVYITADKMYAYVCIGIYQCGKEIRELRLIKLNRNDVKKVKILNCSMQPFIDRCSFESLPSPRYRIGPCKRGEVLLHPLEPVWCELAKLGLNGEPLLAVNHPMAVPAEQSLAIYNRAQMIVANSHHHGIADVVNFSVLESALYDDVAAGLTGSNHSRLAICQLAAGMTDLFPEPIEARFPHSGVIAGVATIDDRFVVLMDNGEEVSYPAGIAINIDPGPIEADVAIGHWTLAGGAMLSPDQVTEDDVLSILAAASTQHGYRVMFEAGNERLLSPCGLLGSSACLDANNEKERFLLFNRSLWSSELGGFCMPAMPHSKVCQFGNISFPVYGSVYEDTSSEVPSHSHVGGRRERKQREVK